MCEIRVVCVFGGNGPTQGEQLHAANSLAIRGRCIEGSTLHHSFGLDASQRLGRGSRVHMPHVCVQCRNGNVFGGQKGGRKERGVADECSGGRVQYNSGMGWHWGSVSECGCSWHPSDLRGCVEGVLGVRVEKGVGKELGERESLDECEGARNKH